MDTQHVFRQWKAEDTHCKFLHGYAVSFRVWFEGELDHRNWVWDFGGMKRSKTKINGYVSKRLFYLATRSHNSYSFR
jgi:6-pyruvoyltetrahydropterin/6-carboxytetrahydropterin synthase